jgi:hypothetical protein
MSKKTLRDAMTNRSPLPKREAVTPVNMYQQAAAPPVGAEAAEQPESTNSGNQETPKAGEPESRKRTRLEGTRVEKYSTLLRPDTIKAIKLQAIESEQKDYEVVQAALDAYLQIHPENPKS